MSKIINDRIYKYILRSRIYVIIILVLLIYINILKPVFILPSIMITLSIILFEIITSDIEKKKKRKEFLDYTSNFNIVTKNTLINSPLPLIIAQTDGRVLWKSNNFKQIFDTPEAMSKIQNEIISIKNEIENSDNKVIIKRDMYYRNQKYYILGEYSRNTKEDKKQKEYILTLFFLNQTKYIKLKEKHEEEKIALSIIRIDNFDEIISKLSIHEKIRVLADIEKIVFNWAYEFEGIPIKQGEDEYVVIFYKKSYEKLKENKLSILDKVKLIKTKLDIPLTISIAISTDGEKLEEKYSNTQKALDVVLGRGGDQAVIKDQEDYKFYGGKTKEVEKTAKVKPRIVAFQIAKKLEKVSNVIIMGHKNIDIDALGSAIGMYKFVKAYTENVYIATDANSEGLGTFREELHKNIEYQNVIINKNEALNLTNKDTLLIVVDVHREEFVEFPEVAKNISDVIVIDHHRKLVDFIDRANVVYHEVYASSAAELVTELIQYSPKEIKLKTFEAESLYGGIMVDTKNFTFKTGVRTFEAAAYLRKFGVDIVKVKKWFAGSLDTYIKIQEIIQNAKKITPKIAIARNSYQSIDTNLICAKAADQMLNISDISGSITYGYDGKVISVSLRSIGDINMQIIAEKLGGGGHMVLAGAQLKQMSLDEAEDKIIKAVKEYIKEVEEVK